MLTDQVFYPKPVCAVGPEMFWSDRPGNIDLGIVRRWLRMQQMSPFNFRHVSVFISPLYGHTKEYFEKVRKFGVVFMGGYGVFPHPDKGHDEFAVQEIQLADLIYSPEFTSLSNVGRSATMPREGFLEVLEEIAESPEPYSKEMADRKVNEWILKHG